MNQMSLNAYEAVKPRISRLHEEVIAVVSLKGDMTPEKIVQEINPNLKKRNTYAPRITELKKMGILVKKGVGFTSNGHKAEVLGLK